MDEIRIPPVGDPFTAATDHPHACGDGWVFVGYIDDSEDIGEEHYEAVRCRRCNA